MASAEIVAIGTEILLGDIVDSNSQLLGKAFAEHGISHLRRTTVGDNLQRATDAIKDALGRADIVVTIGGLGPTMDDLTREAIAQATGDELITDEASLAALKTKYAARGRAVGNAASRMAMRPSRAVHIPNEVGAASGIHLSTNDGQTIIAMPGPRGEFEAMLQGPVRAILALHSSGAFVSRTLKIVGIAESRVEEICKDLMLGDNPTVAPYAKQMEVHLRITGSGPKAKSLVAGTEGTIRGLLGNAIYGADEDTLEGVVVCVLQRIDGTLATAESCTGGMLGQRVTSIPGSGDVYLGGFVTYSNELKARSLGVARADIDKFGAVSEPVARQMSEGVCRVTGAQFGIGITGIAGPGGGGEDKPVGLVFISLTGPRGTEVRREMFPGDRELIRYRATEVALDMLRLELATRESK